MKPYSKHKIGFIIAIAFFIVLMADTSQMSKPVTFIEFAIIGIVGCCVGFGMMVIFGIDSVYDDIKEVKIAYYENKNKPLTDGFPKEII